MQLGFSSYSFYQCLRTRQWTLLDVFDWVAASDGEHLEIATVSLSDDITNDSSTLDTDPELVAAIKAKSASSGVPLSNLVLPANFLTDTREEHDHHLARVKRHIQVADELGIRLLRHDVTAWSRRAENVADFETNLPVIVEACKELAQYAATYGITTSVENHGLFVNASERVRRLIYLVDEPNFKTTLDVGNFLVVDEDPVSAVTQNVGEASIVHLKDFFVRPLEKDPGEGWLRTAGGRFLRGTIVGAGDMDMRGVLRAIKGSGYDGYVSIEFEGIEDCLVGSAQGLANATRLLAEV